MNKIERVVAAFMVAMVLSACGTSDGVGGVDGGAQTISGQVADYTGPAGTLEAKDDANETVVGAGSIKTDGSFTLELKTPSQLIDNAVIPAVSARMCPDLNVSDPGVKGASVSQISVSAAGSAVGSLFQSSLFGDDAEGSFSVVARVYVDRDVEVKGLCTFSNLDAEFRVSYDAEYEQGWNMVVAEVNVSADGVTDTRYSTGAASDVAWSYVLNGGNDDDTVDPPTIPATPNEISGQVQDYTGPAGTLTASNGSGEPMSVGAGSIIADGSFSFELDNPVSEAALQPLGSPEGCSGVEISNPDAKIAGVLELLVMSGDDSVGLLKLSVRSGSDFRTETQWLYADQAVTVQGTCEYSSNTASTDKDTYNLDLKRGWNIISVDQSSSYDTATNIQAFEFDFYNGQAAGVEWSYTDYQ